MTRKHGKIMGISISSTQVSKVLKFIDFSLKKKHKFFIATPNPEILVEASKNNSLQKALRSADILLPDGAGLILASKFLGFKLNRITGRKMFEKILKFADQKNLKIFLLGSSGKVISLCLKRLKGEYSTIKASGFEGPFLDKEGSPITNKDLEAEKRALRMINTFKPDILFVAFGAPKQEIWLNNNLHKLKIGGGMVVGGTFDYFSGVKPLPPRFLSKIGLEWLWRLIYDPKRLKRIFNALVVFPFLVLFKKQNERKN